MSNYNNNIEFLEKYAPALHHEVLHGEPLYPIEIQVYKNNQLRFKRENQMVFANSIYSAESEFEDMFKGVNKECEVLVLYGIGTGEVFAYIKRHFKKLKSLFVVEPFLENFIHFLSVENFYALFQEMGLMTLLVNKTEEEATKMMRDVFEHEKYSSLEIVALNAYYNLAQDYFERFKEFTLRGFRSRMGQFATLHQSKYMWLNNTVENFKFDHYEQEDIAAYLKGKPAVIVAAGPSLNKHVELLSELKERAIFVGAGSAIQILETHGIQPHFRMAIDGNPDPNIYTEAFYDSSENTPLLYSSQLCHDVLPQYRGQKIFMKLPTDRLGQYLYEISGRDFKLTQSGASVVMSAFGFLCDAGCSPIIFIGQDMCFYDNQLYASGRNAQTLDSFDSRLYIKMTDINGKEVYTIRNYLQIKYDYEDALKRYPQTRFINATEGGLGIEGTEVKPLAQVIKEDIPQKIDIDINQILKKHLADKVTKKESLQAGIRQMIEESEKIVDICEERLERVKKLSTEIKNPKAKANKLEIEFEYIDQNIEKELMNIGFYKKVVLENVSVESMALKNRYIPKGVDIVEDVGMGVNYQYRMITEVILFTTVAKELLEEYLEDLKLKEDQI